MSVPIFIFGVLLYLLLIEILQGKQLLKYI